LKTSAQCHCAVKTTGQTVAIEPAEPQLVYVPVYTPVVYGAWAEPAYPPFAFPLPIGLVFGPGVPIDYGPGIELALFGPLWGWGWIDWPHGHIAVDPARYALVAPGRRSFPGGVWTHDAARRVIVAANPIAAARFAAARTAAPAAAARLLVPHHAAPRHFAGVAVGRSPRVAVARPVVHPAPFGFRPGQVVPGPERLAAARFGGPVHVAAEFGPRPFEPFDRRR
jgi:hypothetical protein